MITGISIENFKGIGERVDVELKPITLLFGANSAGKSTILHAFHYLREIFERNNLDADTTIAGGEFVDLGGYLHFVHGHSLRKPIRIGVTLDASVIDLPSMAAELPVPGWELDSEDLLNDFTKVMVELEIGWNESVGAPFVSSYRVEVSGQTLLTLRATVGRREQELLLDMAHPCLRALANVPGLAEMWRGGPLPEDHPFPALIALLDYLRKRAAIPSSSIGKVEGRPILSFTIAGGSDASPCWQSLEPLLSAIHFVEREEQRSIAREQRAEALDVEFSDTDQESMKSQSLEIDAGNLAVETLGRLMIGPAMLVRRLLSQQLYLGPMRVRPSRNFEPLKSPDPARWASGFGAWDRIFFMDDMELYKINSWLSDFERLNSGSRLRVRRFVEADYDEPVIRGLVDYSPVDIEFGGGAKLNSLARLPVRRRISIEPTSTELDLAMTDVGVGLSQVVPVIVAAFDESAALVMLEQPELHLHPRMQVGLGDLFISGIQSVKRTLLIETHSEHLLLRLLRRVRETTQGELPPHADPIRPDQLSINFVETRDNGVNIRRLTVTDSGDFAGWWPEGFFEERAKELF
jgi:hypothetical protein